MKARLTRLTAFILLALGPVLAANAGVGKLLFVTAGDVFIVDAQGEQRAAKRGDEIQPGELLVVGKRGYAQLATDGGYVGARPGSEIRFLGSTRAAHGSGLDVAVSEGSARFLSGEVAGKQGASNVAVQTRDGSFLFLNADTEVGVGRKAGNASDDIGAIVKVYQGSGFQRSPAGDKPIERGVLANFKDGGAVTPVGDLSRHLMMEALVATAGTAGLGLAPTSAAAEPTPGALGISMPPASLSLRPSSSQTPAAASTVGTLPAAVGGIASAIPATASAIAPVTTTVIGPLTNDVIAPLTNSILASPTPTLPVIPVIQQLLTSPLIQRTPLAPR